MCDLFISEKSVELEKVQRGATKMSKEVKALHYKETPRSLGLFSFKRRKQSMTEVCSSYKMMNKVYVNCYSPTPLYQLTEQ